MATISTSDTDSNGLPRLLSNDVQSLQFVNVSTSKFANPDAAWTGYAANGLFYAAGTVNPADKAGWAVEGENDPPLDNHRGTRDAFPDRMFVVCTLSEVVLLDADTLDVWMRFIPLATPTAATYGTLLGDDSTTLTGAFFREGVLSVATDVGVRIADFRADRGYMMNATTAYHSDKAAHGIEDRNTDGYVEDTDFTATGNPTLHAVECLNVVATITGTSIRIAVGHSDGLSGIDMPDAAGGPGSGVPQVKEHAFSVPSGSSFGSWKAYDDGDADSDTPIFRDDAGTNLVDVYGVRIGDDLHTDLPSVHRITGISTDKTTLTVSPELDVADTGANYTIRRGVRKAYIDGGGNLFAITGSNQVIRVLGEEWFDPAGDTDALDVFTGGSAVLSRIALGNGAANQEARGIVETGGAVYVGSDIGVYYTTAENWDVGNAAEHIYGASGSPATYTILEGGFNDVLDLAIDPETGHLAVLTVSGSEGILNEIDAVLQQVFRFENLTDPGPLLTFRNPAGPPTKDIE